jgi:RNA polymerase sigma factor (TIGR02999 family)
MDELSSVEQLLHAASAGDETAMDHLFPLVYADLRRLADSCLRRERPGHTLQGTALVHEAYLRLRNDHQPKYQDRAHFLRLMARVMRQVLVDHARRRNVGKRSESMKVPLAEASEAASQRPELMIELDDALTELEKRDERKARLIEMRFFSGLTAEETASILGMDVRDVRRELRLAQAWLRRQLAERPPTEPLPPSEAEKKSRSAE